MKINDKIRILREMRGWTQENMAEKLNISVNTYSSLERGDSKLYLEKLEKIVAILGVELTELLSNDKQGLVVFFNNGETVSENSPHVNYYSGSTQASIEIEKLKIEIKSKEEIIKEKDKQIAILNKLVETLQK